MLRDTVAQALINRRLEAHARAGGSYLYAQVQQDKVSRSADATFVSFAPLTADWRAALKDVRAVIADALARPPSEEEIDREIAEREAAGDGGRKRGGGGPPTGERPPAPERRACERARHP